MASAAVGKASELKRVTAVAFVGPSMMKCEPAKKAPTSAATAEPKRPYWMGRPAIMA